jgi:hypothetical protein
LFIGVSLDGSALTINNSGNGEYYAQQGILASEIIAPNAPRAPQSAQSFLAALNGTVPAPAPAPSAPTNQPTPTPTPAPNPSQANGLVTYPLEDTHPGTEPPP